MYGSKLISQQIREKNGKLVRLSKTVFQNLLFSTAQKNIRRYENHSNSCEVEKDSA
jgi:hypothetical protein